ncbi:MAG TPA: GtrA family protein [Candidatus Sulfotelmatobacter sp.]|nr:GtrA family protein [Candidatus Sulfotelmatobacter sp.]
MQKTATLAQSLYRHRIAKYLVVGGSTFAIDLSLLFILHGKAHIALAISTTLAYWISITYNFILNRFWTFSKRDKTNLHKHLMAYVVLLGINYLFTVIFVEVASHKINYLVAKTLAVIIQTSWTYFAYKNIVFVERSEAGGIN